MSVQDAKILVNNAQLKYSRIGDRLVVISKPRKIWRVFVFKFWGLWGSLGVLGVLGVFVFKTPEQFHLTGEEFIVMSDEDCINTHNKYQFLTSPQKYNTYHILDHSTEL